MILNKSHTSLVLQLNNVLWKLKANCDSSFGTEDVVSLATCGSVPDGTCVQYANFVTALLCKYYDCGGWH